MNKPGERCPKCDSHRVITTATKIICKSCGYWEYLADYRTSAAFRGVQDE
jgi:ribosomal protein L37AE/L43A